MQMSRKMNTQIIVTVTNQSIHTTIGVVGTDTLTHTFKFVPTETDSHLVKRKPAEGILS